MQIKMIADCQLPIANLQRVKRIVNLPRVIWVKFKIGNRQSAIGNWQSAMIICVI